MRYPNLKEEKQFWEKGYKCVVGIDEVGRGALGGPVVAAAVMIKKFPISNFQFSKIRDSKKLTPKKREDFYKLIRKDPNIEWGIGKVSEKLIDKINIFEATKLAMVKAVENLNTKNQKPKINCLILDGNFKLGLKIPQKSIVKGDEKVLSIALASILAKVYRDKIMKRYGKKFPEYGFEKHKGYPTKFHLKMLKEYGPSPIHRKSFSPLKNFLS